MDKCNIGRLSVFDLQQSLKRFLTYIIYLSCHSGLARIFLVKEGFPTSGNDGRGGNDKIKKGGEDREQGSVVSDQRSENRQQKTDHRQQTTENRQRITEDSGQGSVVRQQTTNNKKEGNMRSKILILGFMFLISMIFIGRVNAAVVHVYDGNDLQAAIDSVPDNSTVYVHPGTYDPIDINGRSRLNIIGYPGATIDGYGFGDDCVYINNSNRILIKGMIIQNAGIVDGEVSPPIPDGTKTAIQRIISGYSGILIYRSSRITIINNIIMWNFFYGIIENLSTIINFISNRIIENGSSGLYTDAVHSLFQGNYIADNGGSGMYMNGNHNTITGNTILNNDVDGIYLNENLSKVTYNTISGNGNSDGYYGINIQGYSNSIIGNRVTNSGDYGIYANYAGCYFSGNYLSGNGDYDGTEGFYINDSNQTVVGNTVLDSDNGDSAGFYINDEACLLQGNTSIGNSIGIFDSYVSTCRLNRCTGNADGGLYNYGGTATRNICTYNGDTGIYVYSEAVVCAFNTVIGNDGQGIYTDEDGNTFISNLISGNTQDGLELDDGQDQVTSNSILGNSYDGILCNTLGEHLINLNIVKLNGKNGINAKSTRGNYIHHNVALSNYRSGGAFFDLRDDSGGSTPINIWENNVYGTKNF